MAMLNIYEDERALAEGTADRLAALIDGAVAAHGNAVISLTGGSTPRALYGLLADDAHPWRTRIDWTRLHLFWGDERHVPPDHPDSNYGMAYDAMLARVPVPPEQVHRMAGEIADPAMAAAEYAESMRRGFRATGRRETRFDIMLLGLGPDAHIASIFPRSRLLEHRGAGGHPRGGSRVEAVPGPDAGTWRITLTPDAIIDSELIVMLVAGGGKADAVHAAIEGAEDVPRFPAQLLRQHSRVEWFLDRGAASRLERRAP